MKTVLALMDNLKGADELNKDLVQNGVPMGSIHFITNEADIPIEKRSKGGFFQNVKDLFGMDVSERERGYYAEGIRRGGVLLAVITEDKTADLARDIMEKHNPVNVDMRAEIWQKAGWSGFDVKAAPYTPEQATHEREKVLPVIEEQLRVGKREIQKGTVRVYTRVIEKPVEEKVTLREEKATIERRPVERPATAAEKEAFHEEHIEIAERAEEPVISKEARVKEEIVVGKEVTERTETIHEKIRSTEVQIEPEEEFRQYFGSISEKDKDYESFRSAYLYAGDLAKDKRYMGKNWSDIEEDIHRDWDRTHPGTWNKLKGTIRHAWE